MGNSIYCCYYDKCQVCLTADNCEGEGVTGYGRGFVEGVIYYKCCSILDSPTATGYGYLCVGHEIRYLWWVTHVCT